jgi:glycosyltransferase involved in cell wall biosynthesis
VKKPDLIIFTEGHPDVDTGFIAPELSIIFDKFENIFVYPLRWEDKPNPFKMPANVFFRQELAFYVKSLSSVQKKIAGTFSQLFRTSILKIRPEKWNKLLNTCGYITLLAKWIRNREFDRTNTIFYSYWLVAPALALSTLKHEKKILYFISRAHGFDLYNERGDYTLNFFKPYIFQNLNKLFCISENGLQYLSDKYIQYSDKFTVSRLGTFNQITNAAVNTDSFEIVSCSSLSPVKRIELLILGIEDFQNRFPEIRIKWTHIGGGELFDSLHSLSRQKLKQGTYEFKGTLSVSEICNLYSNNFYACLINVSESEGLPVSVMEAQSFGIPVIATAVGGTPEIVNELNGLLLSARPAPGEIADAIHNVFTDKEIWKNKRGISRKNWELNFDAEKNYRAFADELLSLI